MSYQINDYREEQKKMTQKQDDDMIRLSHSYKLTFQNVNGEAVLEDLKKRVPPASFVPGMQPNDTIYFEGQRSILTHIEKIITHTPHDRGNESE